MGQYNPNQPLVVGNEFAPVISAPYTPQLFVERGWSFRAGAGFEADQASFFVDSLPPWSVPGHAYVVTIYRRGQEHRTGPLQTVTVPLQIVTGTNTALGGGAPTSTQSIANPTDGWYYRFRTGSTGESFARWSSATIPAELSEPALVEGKRIHDVSILYTASAEPGNEAPVPLEINHYYDVAGQRIPYGTAQVDLAESLTTRIRRSRWGEIVTWFRAGAGTSIDPFTDDTSRATWNYDLLTLFETGSDFLVEFRTDSAAQEGPREIFLHYAAMQITYSQENRVANWGVVLGADYDLTGDTGDAGGYRLGRNTQGPGEGFGFNYPNAITLAPGGGSSQSGGGSAQSTADLTVTIKRADYGPYNNQGPAGKIRALRTVPAFPGHPGLQITNSLEPGAQPVVESSDLLPQIVLQGEGSSASTPDLTVAPVELAHAYGIQWPLQVFSGSSAVQGIVPAAAGPETEMVHLRFWARSREAQTALRLVIETADQGPVTVANVDPSDLDDFPVVAEGWHQVDIEVDPGLLVDDLSVASGTEPEVTDVVHESSGGSTGAWSVTAPAGDLEGQLLLLFHGADLGDIADMPAPTGGETWNLLHDAEDFDSGSGAARLWWKVGGAAEPASYGLTQNSGADGVAIVAAVQHVDETGLRSAEEATTAPQASVSFVETPDVAMDGQIGLDFRFAVRLANPGGTWTPPSGWDLLAGSVATSFVHMGLASRQSPSAGGSQRMTSSAAADDLGRLGVTVTLPGPVVGPAAPRWVSDTSAINPWEILAARVVDPNLPNDVFDPANPSEMGIGTYGGALAEGGIEGDLPDTADIDVSVVWGQAMPTIEGLEAGEAVQPLAVVDPDCPIPPECIADGIRYLRVVWDPIESGFEFVGLGHYDLQRQDDTMDADEWETVAQPVHPLVDVFDDFEARVGVETRYRVRYVHRNGMAGDWSEPAAAEVQAPGVTGVDTDKGVLVFTSNAQPGRNLAYVQTWNGAAVEDFDFVEAETRELQRMYGRDYRVAFRPLERGGVSFSRTLLVNAVRIPVETLRSGFESLRDLAWADLPYVAVRSDRGDRWLANVNVPSGSIRDRRRLYAAEVGIAEVTGRPFPLTPTVCEGMTARGALPGTQFEPRFASTPDTGQFDAADLSIRAEIRMGQFGQRVPLAARYDNATNRGWFLVLTDDGTLDFFIQGTGFDDSSYVSAEVPFGPGDLFWARIDYDPTGGGATSTAQFYTSPGGMVWTPLATTTVTDDPIPADDPTFDGLPLTIGAAADGTAGIPSFDPVGGAGGWNGVISRVQIIGDPIDAEAGLVLPGETGSYAAAPDTPGFGITGDIDVRVAAQRESWEASGVEESMAAPYRDSTDDRSWRFEILGNGRLRFQWTTDGTSGTIDAETSSVAVPGTPGQLLFIRVTRDAGTGEVIFFLGASMVGPWSPLGAAQAGTPSMMFDGAADLEVGARDNGTRTPWEGTIRQVQVRDGIDGILVADPDFAEQPTGTTGFNDDQGNPWTLFGDAEIVQDPTGPQLQADPDFGEQDPEAVQFTDSQGNRWNVAGGICTVDRGL